MKKTKIVCTMGPNTDNPEVMKQLILGGMDIARFNFSHGTHEEQKARMDQLKEIRTKLEKTHRYPAGYERAGDSHGPSGKRPEGDAAGGSGVCPDDGEDHGKCVPLQSDL